MCLCVDTPPYAEEIEEKRAALLAAREKWEEKHSGSYEIAYPSKDPVKQELYERLLEGAREAFNTTGSHSRVRDTLERAKVRVLFALASRTL